MVQTPSTSQIRADCPCCWHCDCCAVSCFIEAHPLRDAPPRRARCSLAVVPQRRRRVPGAGRGDSGGGGWSRGSGRRMERAHDGGLALSSAGGLVVATTRGGRGVWPSCACSLHPATLNPVRPARPVCPARTVSPAHPVSTLHDVSGLSDGSQREKRLLTFSRSGLFSCTRSSSRTRRTRFIRWSPSAPRCVTPRGRARRVSS